MVQNEKVKDLPKPPPKQRKSNTQLSSQLPSMTNDKPDDKQSSLELDNLKMENGRLKRQMAELEELFTQKGHFIVKLEQRIAQLEEEVKNGREAYSQKDIEEMVKHAKFTLQIFGKRVGMEYESQVQLSENYPHVLVPPMLLRDMDQLLNDGDKSASSIFRKVMGVVVEDINIWAKTKGAKQMLLKYADEIGATFEYVSKHKDGFLMKECKSLINQMCAEARRSLRKGNGGDSTMDTTVILDDSSDETEMKQDRPKRKLAVEDDDDADESELELAARDLAESNKIKKSIYGEYESFSESDLVFAD
jgi:hypothetical protein